MVSMGVGEVVCWDLYGATSFSENFKPGHYAVWAKGVYNQKRPRRPVEHTGGIAELRFGDPVQTIDSCAIHLGPVRPDSPELRSGAFALQAVFVVSAFPETVGEKPQRTLRFRAGFFKSSYVNQVKLTVMRVEKVTAHSVT